MDNILQQLNPVYFWDIDFAKMDAKKNKRIIIERVINFGNSKELSLIIAYYSKDVIIKILCGLNFIDIKTLNFFSLYFNVPKTQFKCYTKKPLTNKLWI